MSRNFLKFRNQIIFLLVCETVGFFIASLIIQSNFVLALFCYTLLKNSVLIFALYILFSKIKEENVKVSEVLGSDAKHAFLFGDVGLIMYDDQEYITWVSDLFIELGYDLIGIPLLEFIPEVRDSFVNEEQILRIAIDDKIYELYNNLKTRTLYIKDVTIFEELKDAYYGEKTISGYISIDNYDDTINEVDEQKAAVIQSTIRTSIFEWGSEYGVVIRRYTSDSFFLLLNEDVYQALCNNKFKILTRIREQAKQLGVVLSLSIGLGRKALNLHELDEMAYSALNLAISRGGDQVVIKTEGEELRFFGGSTEKYGNYSRVRARVVAQSLMGVIKKSNHILIMGHRESDFDCLGASIAISKICDLFGVANNIIINKESIEEKTNRAVKELLEISEYQKKIISPSVAVDLLRLHPLVITVDNHKPSLAVDERILKAKEIVVIDHHRRGEEFVDSPIMTYLEPSASSTVELICELFEYLPIPMKMEQLESTILYAGILVDTNNFKNRVGSRTFQVASILKRLDCSVSRAYEFLEDDYTSTLEKAKIMQSAVLYKDDIIIATSKEDEIQTRAFLAKAANELLEVAEMKGAFIIGKISETKIAISARSKANINSQVIMEKLGGGGHFTMAACQIENATIDEVYQMLCEKIEEYLEEGRD